MESSSTEAFYFSDDEYGKVLDNIVVTCVDVAIIYDGKILLERRTKDPAKDLLWIFGGRMKVGESFQQAAQRGVRRELGLDIAEHRFRKLNTYSLVWSVRREFPSQNGCHHVLVAHSVELTDQEKALVDAVILSNPAIQWFTSSEVENLHESLELKAIIEDLNMEYKSNV